MARKIAGRADVIPPLTEVFRDHGYGGASLALIAEATGLGKGSLYHFFPGGKEEMAAAVLAEIEAWFEGNVFAPLHSGGRPEKAISSMFDAIDEYFQSGRRVCLMGALALGDARERFAAPVRDYFARWVAALADALVRSGRATADAQALAEETVGGIQGAIVLSRALGEPAAFGRALDRLRQRLAITE